MSEIEQNKKADVSHSEIRQDDFEDNLDKLEDGKLEVIDPADELPESLQGLSEEELEKLKKKVTRIADIRLLPCLVILYILNYLDRNNIASARLGGLEEDLNLKGNEYQTCVSILFALYILMQVPANMFLNKFARPSIFISAIMCVWGLISMCTGFVSIYDDPNGEGLPEGKSGFGGLLAIRAILGLVESAYFPACLYLLSSWYDRLELGVRNTILYSGSLLSGAFSGLIAAGIINQMDYVKGLRSWRWLFLIEGAITVGLAPIAYFVLPDMPHNTKFLSQQEKDIIIWKLKREVGQNDSDTENKEGSMGSLKLAVCDIKVWLVTGCLSWLVAACGVTNYFPSIIETLGFDRIITLVLSAPPYLLAVVATFLWARHSDKTGERFWHVVAPLFISLISFIINVSTLNVGARYFGMVIMIPSLYCSFTTILSWMSNCVPRPPLKRAIALSIMNCLSNSASIWNSYLYFNDAAPRYLVAYVCNCVFILLAIGCAFILRARLTKLNKRILTGSMNWEKELGKGNDGSKISPNFRFLI